MENWGSWLAADRRVSVATGVELPDRDEGSVLVADISGFTPLTEALVRALGPKRGAEEITTHLDRIYDLLVGAVDRRGGSVVGFSGDAITAWFPADDGSRAVSAGLAMQEAVSGLEEISIGAAEPVAVGVRVAVTVGQVRRFCIGNDDVQLLDALAGATVERVGVVEQLAERGDVVLEADAAAALADRIVVGAWREQEDCRVAVVDAVRAVPEEHLDDAALTEEQARAWILPVVHRRLAAGQGSFLAELRPVVAVFVRFTGINYADPGAGGLMDRYVSWAQRVLDRYEGTLVDVTIGDKGSYLAAVVGAPRTHPDDAVRAVAAALELSDPPADLAPVVTAGVGVSSGRMRCGAFGGALRRTYGVQGSDMNLAARLMVRAEGEVLVTSQVADAVRERFDLQSRGAVSAKGFEMPVESFRVSAARSATTGLRGRPAEDLVGRDEERALVDRSLADLVGGHSGLLVIEGDPGIGKSHLMHDLVAGAGRRDLTTWTARAEAVEQSTPYHAWQAIVADALGLAEAPAEPAAAVDWLVHRLGGTEASHGTDLSPLAPLLAPVLPFPVPDTAETELMTGQSRAEATREVIAEILRARARERPLVLVLDDAHWLDSASWALLARLAGVPEPLLVAIAMRPVGEEAPPEVAGLLAAPITTRVPLTPLAQDAVEVLVRRRLDVRTVAPAVAAVVAERSDGNPFFAEELAAALVDRGLVVVRDGRCEMAPGAPDLLSMDLPDTVEGVVTSRIDLLSPAQQTTLKVASVLGASFTTDTLQAVHPMQPSGADLDRDLADLDRLGFTLGDEPAVTGHRFRHAISQHVAYGLMLFAQRRDLHRAVAEHLEATAPDDDALLPLLAHHWAAAADDDQAPAEVVTRAIDHLGRAAAAALAAYANIETTTHLRKQIALLDRQPPSMERDQTELGAQTMIAFSMVQTRGYGDPEVEAAYRRAQELVERVADFGPLPFILYGLFSFYSSRGLYAQADAATDRLFELAERSGDEATRSVALQARAIVRLLSGEPALALEQARESYEIADRLGHRAFFGFGVDFRIYTSAWVALAECLLGMPDTAMRTFVSGQGLAGDQQPYARCFVLAFAVVPQLRADLAETRRWNDELARLSGRYSFFLLVTIATMVRGWLAAADGSPEGLEEIEAGLPVPRFVRLDAFLPWYLILAADARLRLGQADDALAAITEAGAVVASMGSSIFEPELLRLRAHVERARGADQEVVRDALAGAVRRAREQGARWWELRALADLVEHDRDCDSDSGSDDAASAAELARLVDGLDEGGGTPDVDRARALVDDRPPADQ